MNHTRRPACPDRRDALVALAGGVVSSDPVTEAHAGACEGCRAFLDRATLQRRALSHLPPVPAPRSLDGLVVAATQAGFRQERAVAALRVLGTTPMPLEVERAIWPAELGAPPALDELVDRQLLDPTRAIARRLTGRLGRLRAPLELDQRVALACTLAQKRRDRFARRFALSAAALMLVGLAWLGTWFAITRPDQVAARQPEPHFVIERVNSLADLGPLSQATLAGLLGGLPDADRIAKEKL